MFEGVKMGRPKEAKYRPIMMRLDLESYRVMAKTREEAIKTAINEINYYRKRGYTRKNVHKVDLIIRYADGTAFWDVVFKRDV